MRQVLLTPYWLTPFHDVFWFYRWLPDATGHIACVRENLPFPLAFLTLLTTSLSIWFIPLQALCCRGAYYNCWPCQRSCDNHSLCQRCCQNYWLWQRSCLGSRRSDYSRSLWFLSWRRIHSLCICEIYTAQILFNLFILFGLGKV